MSRRLSADRLDRLDATERGVLAGVVGFGVLLVLATAADVIQLSYLVPTLALTGMWVLLTLGLNVQWGYAGLINFSVAAFWGIGMYCVALLVAPDSPLGLELHPIVALAAVVVVSAAVAVAIGVPTLRLRADYLAIASLGLAEIIRLIVKNQEGITAGTRGIIVPELFPSLPALADSVLTWDAASGFPYRGFVDLALVGAAVFLVYLFLRRLHRSPWGRVLRTIRSDEELAKALGKNTYRFKMEAFVIGSVLMALAGFFYAFQFQFVAPSNLEPITTFYVWIAVIIGGTGSNRGAVIGGVSIVLIRQGPRFFNDIGVLPFDPAAFRLLLVGALIVLVIRYRSAGILPPRAELVWPSARRSAAVADGGEER
jgi:branched-chain amino acid transport system permease protein